MKEEEYNVIAYKKDSKSILVDGYYLLLIQILMKWL